MPLSPPTETAGRWELPLWSEWSPSRQGQFLLKSLKNKRTGRELIPAGTASDEFSVRLGDGKQLLTGSTGPWKLVREHQTRLGQGELQWEVVLQQGPLLVTKSYVVYPGSSIIREWVTFANAGQGAAAAGRAGLSQPGDAAGRTRGARLPLDDRRRKPARLVGAEDGKAWPGQAADVRFLRALSVAAPLVPRRWDQCQDHAQRQAGLAGQGLAIRCQCHRHRALRRSTSTWRLETSWPSS